MYLTLSSTNKKIAAESSSVEITISFIPCTCMYDFQPFVYQDDQNSMYHFFLLSYIYKTLFTSITTVLLLVVLGNTMKVKLYVY